MPEIGKRYSLDGELLRCDKIHESGVCVFTVIDKDDNVLTEITETSIGQTVSNCKRIIYYRLNELKELKGTITGQLTLF